MTHQSCQIWTVVSAQSRSLTGSIFQQQMYLVWCYFGFSRKQNAGACWCHHHGDFTILYEWVGNSFGWKAWDIPQWWVWPYPADLFGDLCILPVTQSVTASTMEKTDQRLPQVCLGCIHVLGNSFSIIPVKPPYVLLTFPVYWRLCSNCKYLFCRTTGHEISFREFRL